MALPTHQTLYQLDHDRVRRGIAHLFSAEQGATAPQRLFLAWLRTHPADRDTRLKQTLRESGTWDATTQPPKLRSSTASPP